MKDPATPLHEHGHQQLTLIHRQVSFELAAFDRLKLWQRHLEGIEGHRITNSEVMCRLILTNDAP